MGRTSPALLLLAAVVPAPLGAQTGEVVEACAVAGPELQPWCTELALAVQAAQGDMALLASGGTEVPGTASTLGKRVGSSPRWSFAGRLAGVVFEGPDVSNPSSVPAPGVSGLGVAAQGTVAFGLFRGFSPTPTMGGLFALDLLANGSLLWGPGGLGYQGTNVGYGLGARLGVFRESFTLPGITLSVAQRWIQGIELANVGTAQGAGSLELGVSTTSIRGEIGKDLWGVGWLGGVGWDRSNSDGSVPTPESGSASFEDVSNDRGLFFIGASWSYFLIQVSAEAGWASGWSQDGSDRSGGAYDPSSGRFFGGLAVRFIY